MLRLLTIRSVRRALLGIIGAFFIIAGLAKLFDPKETIQTLSIAGLPQPLANAVIWVIPPLEIGLGYGLLVLPRVREPIFLAAAIVAIYTGFLAWLLHVDPSAECSCYGDTIEQWVGGNIQSGIIRNAVVLVILFACLPLSSRSTTQLARSDDAFDSRQS